MPGGWTDSTRVMPPGWPAIRAAVLARDGYQCVARLKTGARCPARATDVDHIGDRHDHHPDNLRSLCGWHHAQRTSQQANAAKKMKRQANRQRPHPGLSPEPRPQAADGPAARPGGDPPSPRVWPPGRCCV